MPYVDNKEVPHFAESINVQITPRRAKTHRPKTRRNPTAVRKIEMRCML